MNGAAARAPSGDNVPTSGTASAESAPPSPVPIRPVDALSFVDDAPEFPPAVREALATPVDPELVEMRATEKDGPEKLCYVPWVHYQAVLLKAFGPGGYRLVPRSVPRTEGNVITWVGALFVRVPGTTKFVFIKEAKGECATQGGKMTAGNGAEGAQSDCLVKCCKALGIFMELFDPRWRRAWEDKYKGKYQQSKRQAAWPAGRAPAQPVPVAGSSSAPTPPVQSATGDGAAPAAGAAPADTGEAATAEQLEAIRGRIKALAWKVGYMRIWFDETFGIKAERPERILGALTQVQADAAFTLLTAFNQKAAYQRIIGELREKGVVAR